MLLFIPAGANAQIGASTREDIQRRDRLDQQAWIPIGHARDHGSQLDPIGSCGGKGQRTVAFQHLVRGRTDAGNLEEVVHDPQTEQTGSLCSLGNQAKRLTERSLMIGPGKAGDL